MALLNYTTEIDADKTATEIVKILAKHGASSILTDYQDGVLSAISFTITVDGRKMGFRLPCDWRPVLVILTSGKENPHDARWHEQKHNAWNARWQQQAVRTAWRIVKDWVEAQMALVQTRMVTTQQVFLPYAVLPGGQTLAERMETNPGFLLGE